MIPSPPIILSAYLAPLDASAGDPVTAELLWTGRPQTGVGFQWRRYGRDIPGEIGVSIPSDGHGDDGLDCEITIDNGWGTAAAIATFVTIPAVVPVEPTPTDPTDPTTPGVRQFGIGFGAGFRR